MHTEIRIAAVLAVLVAVSGCDQPFVVSPEPVSQFGEANRQTMLAQVVDPAPVYDDLNPPTSAEHASQAAERYRTDKVKEPRRVSSTMSGSSGGGGS